MDKFVNIILFFFINLLLLFPAADLSAQTPDGSEEGGFLLLAGKKTNHLNSVLLAYNNYQTDKHISFLKKYPRMQNDSGEMIRFNNGVKIPKRLISFEWMFMNTNSDYLIGDAVGVNEDGVAIGGIVSLAKDRNIKARMADPLVDKGIPAAIGYVALQRFRSAKQCVRMMGEFFNEYGISEAKGIAVADKDEIWYLETGGGTHWAAIKIPPDACWIQGNRYRIGFIDPADTDVLASPELKSFAKENNLWNPTEELFNFAKAFGGRIKKTRKKQNSENMKFWRVYNKLKPSENIEPNRENYPTFVRPEKKLTLNKLSSILRDEYRGTEFYPHAPDTTVNLDTTYQVDSTYQADTLSQVDSVRKIDTIYKIDTTSDKYSPIANKSTVYSSIIEIREGFRSELKSILWASPGNPITTPFIPFYFGLEKIPEHYNFSSVRRESASKYFNELASNYYNNPNRYADELPVIFSEFQNRCFLEQSLIDRQVYRILRNSPDMAVNFLTVTVDGYCQDALEIAREKLEKIEEQE